MTRVFRFLLLGAAVAFAGSLTTSLSAQQQKGPEVVILKGAPSGGVKFTHAAHQKLTKCETCHHPSRPEKPSKAENQKCSDCHEKKAAPPMKTAIRGAFHDPMAKKGTCIDCHVKQAAEGKKPPTPGKCAECHKKENV
jgi:hypothetical protein